jgi:fermentation-respiration switch protein FrsA (DUF1100 family)
MAGPTTAPTTGSCPERDRGRAFMVGSRVGIDGATHIDLYDKDEYVTPAVAKLTEFFSKHLAG